MGKKLNQNKVQKYLGVILDEHFSFNEHMNKLKQKLNRADGMLAKLRYYVPANTLKTIYHALFDSHRRYACQIWVRVTVKHLM